MLVGLVLLWLARGLGGGTTERPDAGRAPQLWVVVARYNEDLDAVARLVARARASGVFRDVLVRVYNKGPALTGEWWPVQEAGPVPPVVGRPNVGRCDHTYLYHLVAHHPPPPHTTTWFLPASVGDPRKWPIAEHIWRHLLCRPRASSWRSGRPPTP